MIPQETITAFDAFLAERGDSFEAIIVGSTALALLGGRRSSRSEPGLRGEMATRAGRSTFGTRSRI
jgi:hypothetical protein